MKHVNLLMIAALVSFTFASCQKDSTTTTDPLVSSSVDDDQVTSYYDDATSEIDDITMTDGSQQSAPASYAALTDATSSRTVSVVTNNDGSITKTVTYVNYTNPNAVNGHVKNGVIVINIVGGPLQNEFTRTATFQNFTLDGNKVEGTRTITKTAEYTYTYTLTNGKVTFSDGTTYTREATQTRTWVDGMSTPYFIWDDIYSLEGTETGVNRSGETYTHTIVNALQIKMSCRWIVSGSVDITIGNETGTVDYGDGSCDNIATLSRNGKTYQFQLGRS